MSKLKGKGSFFPPPFTKWQFLTYYFLLISLLPIDRGTELGSTSSITYCQLQLDSSAQKSVSVRFLGFTEPLEPCLELEETEGALWHSWLTCVFQKHWPFSAWRNLALSDFILYVLKNSTSSTASCFTHRTHGGEQHGSSGLRDLEERLLVSWETYQSSDCSRETYFHLQFLRGHLFNCRLFLKSTFLSAAENQGDVELLLNSGLHWASCQAVGSHMRYRLWRNHKNSFQALQI